MQKSAEQHLATEYDDNSIKCSNCIRYNKNIKPNVQVRVNHTATDDRCPVKQLRIEGLKNHADQ